LPGPATTGPVRDGGRRSAVGDPRRNGGGDHRDGPVRRNARPAQRATDRADDAAAVSEDGGEMSPGGMASPTLRGVHLTRTFGDGAKRRAALRDVSIELFPGQIALLMGPSGSGKSTLLALLSGLLEPDSGQVLADDDGHLRDVWAMSPKERE